MKQFDLTLPDGRTLHGYDREAGQLPVFWHHGTPNVGEPPAPLFEAADRSGIRWVSFDRPGYGGSTAQPDRSMGSTADWVSAVADRLGLDSFALMGHSGGSSHALAAAAQLPDRTRAVVAVAPLAPFGVAGSRLVRRHGRSGVAGLTAARNGRRGQGGL